MSSDKLPPFLQDVARRFPSVWEAYSRLGETVAEVGPLDAATERLVKLAIAVGGGLEGAVHSHARRGLAMGLSADQLRHVALLAITTMGWPSAMAALSWVEDVIQKSASGGDKSARQATKDD
jgi:alkylhydroperoxidase/carboxymuconolactone decarboxylase family protein YurZ